MIGNIVGPDLGVFLIIAVVVIFGGSQLPKIARNVGSAGKEFRKAQREAEEEEAAKKAPSIPVPPAVTAGPVVAPVGTPVVAAPIVAAVPADDHVTISKADLAALLDERLGKGETSGSTN